MVVPFDDTCTDCSLLVGLLEAPVKAGNFTIQTLTWAVEEICDHLPMLRIQHHLCEAITRSISEIVKLVTNGMAPKDICANLKLCPQEVPEISAVVIPLDNTCADCSLIVGLLEAPVKAGNSTIQSLTWVVEEICDHLLMLRIQHQLCGAITSSVSEIAKLITDGIAPNDICANLKLCPQQVADEGPQISAVVIPLDNTCYDCSVVVGLLEAPVKAGNFTVQSLTWVVQEICDHLPMLKIQHQLCGAITSSVSEIAKLITEGMAPKDICANLKLCPQQPSNGTHHNIFFFYNLHTCILIFF